MHTNASTKFVHLNVHSEYSLQDSVIRIKELASHVQNLQMPAVALTDANNLFAAVKFYNTMLAKGIKPIIGADIVVVDGEESFDLTLLCQNNQGYINLSEIISLAYMQGNHAGKLQVQAEWVLTRSEGLIAISSSYSGIFATQFRRQNLELENLKNAMLHWLSAFENRWYCSISRLGRKHERIANHNLCQLANFLSLPVVACNDVRFLRSDDYHAHEVRVAIHDGFTLDDKRRPKNYTPEQYLRTPKEMLDLFHDIPSAIENTVELAKRCNLEITQGAPVLPAFPVPEGMTTAEFLRSESHRLLIDKYEAISSVNDASSATFETYKARLDTELAVIENMGFPGYFLIVADFIQWAKKNDIPVGPGRGSGAGSLVAYVLGITDLDPLEYDLLFERFLNPERVSMPDFDIDFCIEGRDRVIDYVAEKYGRDHVSQIITFGTMAARAVVRDVARVQGHSYGFADRIAKLIPFQVGMTLTQALEDEAELKRLYDEDDEVKALLDMALSLEGLSRNAGKHAGGIIIAPNKLTDFMPIFCEEGGQQNPVCQFDKDDAEKIGLVKFDFLGLKTLTIIDNAVKLIKADKEFGNADINIHALSLDDAEVYQFLSSGRTKAIFQLESVGMQKLIKELVPTQFEDVIALLALYRPGPLNAGMHHTFVARKHGYEEVDFPHDSLKEILAPTYGVILYQEQVMQIAQIMGGYSLGGADLLRRAMGKKKREEMVKQREIFLQGSHKNSVDAKTANYVFDLMEKFADYGFNKSHSAAYALISYQTAWLKHYYPAHFMAAVMSADMDHTDKLVSLKRDCVKEFNLTLEPPCVNRSEYRFTVTGERSISYGLGAIKGVGYAVVKAIIDERQESGLFKDFWDFCTRCSDLKLSRRTFEALIKAGAFDQFAINRATLLHNLEAILQFSKQTEQNNHSGMEDMFGFSGSTETTTQAISLDVVADWKHLDRMSAEKSSLGLYLSGHPVDYVIDELVSMTGSNLESIKQNAYEALSQSPQESKSTSNSYQRNAGMPVAVAGLVVDFRKRGNRVSLVLDDDTDRIEVGLFEKEYEQYRHLLAKDKILVVVGKLGFDDYLNDFKVNCDRLYDLDEARDQWAGRILIRYKNHSYMSSEPSTWTQNLNKILSPHLDGHCKIALIYSNDKAKASLDFGQQWKVKPNRLMIENLKKLFGKENVKIQYQRTPIEQ